mgnify:CR=1 FL=1
MQSLSEGKARNYSKSQNFYRGRKLGIFPNPRAYVGEGGSELGIFPSPKACIGGGGCSYKDSGKIKKYEGKMKKYDEI